MTKVVTIAFFTGRLNVSSIEHETDTYMGNVNVVKEGFAYDLHCKVDFSKELNSNIQWFHNDLIVSNNENYFVNNITLENDGDLLECKYTDAIDSGSTKFNLDVQC